MILPGSRLAHYEITSPLGQGGMGEVWRAQDTKLGREVAIKVLPEQFSRDAERVARMEREARMLAALNHPNIAAIHGLEESDGTNFLVLELVEGETLAERLKSGAIPVAESLELALQIAEALEAAHEKGVVHRDLKPANIKVTPNGRIKVLDFGLAKAFIGDAADVDLSNSPTLSMEATRQGVILGTAGYMSPEQARGETADHRSDVWAFGVVLFEMLTGRTTFDGRTVSDVLAGVLAKDPPWNDLPSHLHPRLRQLLERCLAKELKERYAGISDARVDIAAVLADPGRGIVKPVGAATRESPGIGRVLPWAAAAVVLAAGFGWFLRPLPEVDPPVLTRFSVTLPAGQELDTAVRPVGISRDGTMLAWSSGDRIWIREMREPLPRPVPGTEPTNGVNVSRPVFAPDGESLAFTEFSPPGTTVLKRVPVAGGTPIELLTGTGALRNYSWPTEDTILVATEAGIVRIPATGGEAEVLIAAPDGEAHDSPQLLPGGRQVLFTSGTTGNWDAATIYIQEIGTDERTAVMEGGGAATWVATGHIVYANGNALFARPWNLDRMEPGGGVVEVVPGVLRSTLANGFTDTAHYDVSDNGTLIFVPGTNAETQTAQARRSLVWLDPETGVETPVPIAADDFRMVRIAPDGRRAAAVIGTPGDIYIYSLETGTRQQLTFSSNADEIYPLWLDDDELVFTSRFVAESQGIYAIPADGGEAQLLASSDSPNGALADSLSPDGNTLLVGYPRSDTEADVAVLDLTNPTELRTLVPGNPAAANPAFSQDGNWVAAVESRASMPSQIVLRPYPDVGRTRVSIPESAVIQRHPLFFGERLYFVNTGQGIWSVDVGFDPSITIGQTAREVVNGPYRYGVNNNDGAGGRAWDIHPDGRFLLIRRDEGLAADSENTPDGLAVIHVVANWFQELLERVPVD